MRVNEARIRLPRRLFQSIKNEDLVKIQSDRHAGESRGPESRSKEVRDRLKDWIATPALDLIQGSPQ
jgi:hypothetical protein